MRHLLLATSALLALAMPLSAAAEQLAAPQGPVLLTVSGALANTNSGDTAQFDLAMLDALAQRVTTTETPWYDAAQTFSGPLGSALLEAVGAQGTTVTVTALNDYSADIPIEDFLDHAVILATRLDDKPLSVRDKGPLFVIYPFDEEPDLYNEVYFGRSVWQITAITIR